MGGSTSTSLSSPNEGIGGSGVVVRNTRLSFMNAILRTTQEVPFAMVTAKLSKANGVETQDARGTDSNAIRPPSGASVLRLRGGETSSITTLVVELHRWHDDTAAAMTTALGEQTSNHVKECDSDRLTVCDAVDELD
jgi:hypothetical protein